MKETGYDKDKLELYVLRHGIAVSRGDRVYPNDDRPLTNDGIQKMKKEAKGMRRVVDTFDLVLTSPLKRARATAEIAASALRCSKKIKICPQLLPGAPVKRLAGLIAGYKKPGRILLVGHEPDLGLFVSYLLGAKGPAIELKKGALCRIDVPFVAGRGKGALIWLLPPKFLSRLAGGYD